MLQTNQPRRRCHANGEDAQATSGLELSIIKPAGISKHALFPPLQMAQKHEQSHFKLLYLYTYS